MDGLPADRAAIVTRGLTKRYRGGQLAVDGLDLAVPRGSVFGFLGPNGSGKTTTIRMLMGLIEPTAGMARVLGEPMPRSGRRVLPKVGALIEGPAGERYVLEVNARAEFAGLTRACELDVAALIAEHLVARASA